MYPVSKLGQKVFFVLSIFVKSGARLDNRGIHSISNSAIRSPPEEQRWYNSNFSFQSIFLSSWSQEPAWRTDAYNSSFGSQESTWRIEKSGVRLENRDIQFKFRKSGARLYNRVQQLGARLDNRGIHSISSSAVRSPPGEQRIHFKLAVREPRLENRAPTWRTRENNSSF